MKKIIIIALAVFLCGTAYASKFEVSGDAYYRGKSLTNETLKTDSKDVITKNLYDFDMNVHAKFVVDETTFAYARFALNDDNAGETDTDPDDNISVERSYLSTKIGPTQVDVGLMTGGEWASCFANSAAGKWRIKTVTTTPVGAVLAIIQKDNEASSGTQDDREDNDTYYLALVTKAGPLFVKPLFVFADQNNASATLDDAQVMAFTLGLDGKFGDISFEAEFGYKSLEWDESAYSDYDYSVYGAYVAVTMAMGDNSFGGFLAYSSVDDDTKSNYGMGEDMTYGLIVGGEKFLGANDTSKLEEIGGWTLVGLQASFKVMDKLTVSPMFLYAMSNYDKGDRTSKGDDYETAMELDINAAYKVNDAVTYSFGAGYATIAAFDSASDPEPVTILYHKLAIAF